MVDRILFFCPVKRMLNFEDRHSAKLSVRVAERIICCIVCRDIECPFSRPVLAAFAPHEQPTKKGGNARIFFSVAEW